MKTISVEGKLLTIIESDRLALAVAILVALPWLLLAAVLYFHL